MRLSELKAGLRVLFRPNGCGSEMGKVLPATVVIRGSEVVGCKCPTLIHVDAYAGMDGSHDKGAVRLSAYQVRHLLRPMPLDGEAS